MNVLGEIVNGDYRVSEFRELRSAPSHGSGIVRYSGKLARDCGCGADKDFTLEFGADDKPATKDELIAAIGAATL